MREILFRGKAIGREESRFYRTQYKNGDWVYGLLTDVENYAGFSAMTNTDGISEIDVDKNTIGQFTGSTDKNGKKIFEGDIIELYFFDKTRRNGELVEVKNTRTMVVEWHRNSFYMRELFRNYRLDKEMNIITEVIHDYKGDRKQGVYKSNSVYFVEVIGNIYDNPELIGE